MAYRTSRLGVMIFVHYSSTVWEVKKKIWFPMIRRLRKSERSRPLALQVCVALIWTHGRTGQSTTLLCPSEISSRQLSPTLVRGSKGSFFSFATWPSTCSGVVCFYEWATGDEPWIAEEPGSPLQDPIDGLATVTQCPQQIVSRRKTGF